MEKAEEYTNDWSTSPIMNMPIKTQVAVVGGVIGVPALAICDAVIGITEWAIVPEAMGIVGLVYGAKYMLKRQGINLGEYVKDLNWGALLPGYEPPTVEESAEQEEECQPKDEPQDMQEEEFEQQPSEDDIFLSRTLFPHANAVFSNRVAILGIPGAGKSNTVAVFAEELGRFGTPLIIFDTDNEYGPLCAGRYFKRPFIADRYSVDLETAFSFGQRIMEERLQVVLNLDSYDDDDLAALIMIDVIKGIQYWEEALSNDDRIPCAIILDEAAVWLPQNAGESLLSKDKDENGQTLLSKLQKIFFSVVVRRGRKRGIGFILASQRSAEIDKRAIASAQWKFLHLQNMPQDLDIYAQFGVDKATAQALRPGEAFVLGPGVKGVHQMRKRRSPDNAKTPGLESLRKRRYTESLAVRSPQVTQVIEPMVTRRLPEMEDLPVKPPVVAYQPTKGPARHASEDDRKIKKALQYREQGYGSTRKLETVSGWSNGECRRILRLIKEKGL